MTNACHACAGERLPMICPCHLERCRVCGSIRAVAKCPKHAAAYPHSGDARSYFENSGGIVGGIPMNDTVIRELQGFLRKVDVELPRSGLALEIGAGIGRYAPLLLRQGLTYCACEPSPWAAEYVRHAYACGVFQSSFEDLAMADGAVELVLAAHVLEHLRDPAAALSKIHRILAPGGMLLLVMPDDTDLYNADHLWFFSEPALRHWVAEAGFVDVLTRVEQVIKREKFVYLVGRKGT